MSFNLCQYGFEYIFLIYVCMILKHVIMILNIYHYDFEYMSLRF